jgi:hypothetical protein
MTEVWTTVQVGEYLGVAPTSVRKQMERWGVEVHDREPGKGGANRYRADDVRAARERAPGRAWRAGEKRTG